MSKEAKRKYNKSEKGKAAQKRYREKRSEKCKISRTHYRESKKHETTRRQYEQTEKYKSERHKRYLKKKYNLTLEEHLEIYVNQNGCCAICHEAVSYDKIKVDHDHVTGKVRAMLCHRCNYGMGFIDDDFIRKARKYLKIYS